MKHDAHDQLPCLAQPDSGLRWLAQPSEDKSFPPPSGENPASAWRQALYQGARLLASARPASLALAERALGHVRESLGQEPRQAHQHLSPEGWFARVGQARRALYTDPWLDEGLASLLGALGLEVAAWQVQAPKLRAIVPRGHLNPAAAAVYYAHRDTWYGEPRGVINLWIPLHDVGADETFVWYPRWFDQAIANDSQTFEYRAWKAAHGGQPIGWQHSQTHNQAHYPTVAAAARSWLGPHEAVGFGAHQGDIIVFSGAHLHQTCCLEGTQTRFSVDLRLVHAGDHAAGQGAPQVDTACQGSALEQYRVLPCPSPQKTAACQEHLEPPC